MSDAAKMEFFTNLFRQRYLSLLRFDFLLLLRINIVNLRLHSSHTNNEPYARRRLAHCYWVFEYDTSYVPQIVDNHETALVDSHSNDIDRFL